MGRVFINGPGNLGSILDRVIPKTKKIVLDASFLNTQHYKVRIKGRVEQSWEKRSALPWFSSYRKGSLRVTLDYSCQLYLLYLGRRIWKWTYFLLVSYRFCSTGIPQFWKKAFSICFFVYMISIDSDVSQSRVVETSQFAFKITNVCLLLRNTIFAITFRPKVFKNNTIENTKTNKYFHQIIW